MRHITDLPTEVITVIGDFLPCRNSIHSTVLTCKLFHEQFSRLLWKAVAVSTNDFNPGPDPTSLKAHAHLVHDLSYEGHLQGEYYNISFPRLTSLYLWANEIKSSSQALDADWSILVMLNRTVRDIDISAYIPICLVDVWDAIVTSLYCPRRLTISGKYLSVIMNDEDTRAFWRACGRFEEINYKGRDQAATSRGFVDYDYSQLKRLRYKATEFASHAQGQIDWVGKCYNLTQFRWEYSKRLIPLQRFADLAQMSTWPLLEDICIGRTSGTDEQLGVIFGHLPPLKHWKLKSGCFGPLAFDQLRGRHFDSITTLRMPKVDTFTSRMALETLSHCPQLEVFEARRISLEDICLSPRPWVCRRLRRLVAFFTMASNQSDGAETLFFEQLSRLEQLEDIDVSQAPLLGSDYKAIFEPAPQWRLDHGLSRLSTLSRLRRFKCDHGMQDMRVEDVEWMLVHWPSLRMFSWRVSLDKDAQRDITALIEERGCNSISLFTYE
ncbi:hypothetical protein EC957_008658 [Mortierella hygrophila]|uniref:F-box domain-containing protein n=1 Tax=Mortierella hygrophila TaxID=979708 RepID=A0A9P6FCI6_9FUNG|nr:hypothetical protein EC957_008658 [Mortierella hygrophila]